jgi:5,10-methylenetetrahydromethanopterin reductase
VCGIGVGDRPLHELGLPFAKLATLAETIDALRALWRGETLTGRAGPHRFQSAQLPAPVPELPVYVAASRPRALELAGEHGDGAIVLAGLFPEALAYTRERIAAGRSRSRRGAFEVVAFLYGAIDDDEEAALAAGRSIAAWFPQTAPAHARLAGMSDELIDGVAAAYAGGEFQEAAVAARLIPDELVRKLAFVGTPETAAQKLDSLRGEGLDAVSIFPLGESRRETIAAFADLAFART